MQNTGHLVRSSAPATPVPPFNLTATLLLAGLTTSLVVVGSGLLLRFVPSWRPSYLGLACCFVALEAALVRYRMLLGRHLEPGALSYLAAEIFSLAVLMRAVATLSLGIEGVPVQLDAWVRSPLRAIDGPFVACFTVGVAVGLLVRAGLRDFAALAPRTTLPIVERGLDADVLRADAERQERAAGSRIAAGLGWGAALVLLALTGQVLNVERVGAPPLPLAPWAGVAGIAYLICAALLYSSSRLGLLQARWQRDEAAVDPAVTARWRLASVVLVLAIAGAGLLLPGGIGTDLVAAAQGGMVLLVNLVSLVALFLGVVALGALGVLLTIPALLLAWLGAGPPLPITPPQLPPQQPPPVAPSPAEAPLVPGVVFWVCVGLLATYALWAVLKRQEWAVSLGRRLRAGVLQPLLAWLRGLWAGVAGYARAVGEAVAERLRPPPPSPTPPPRTRLRNLGPAELVRFFYRSVLARAERAGLARRHAETPHEYGARLRAQLPAEAAEVDQLTDAYLAATYAPRPTSPAEARKARGLWVRIRRALRGP